MNVRTLIFLVGIATFSLLLAAGPASQPGATADGPPLTDLQQNLLMQLSDAEANIQANNKIRVPTGYKVELAYRQIANNEKGNEYISRNRGGRVQFDAFSRGHA